MSLMVVAVSLALFLTSLPAVVSSNATERDEPPDLAGAIRFRIDMGFPSDLDLVTRAAEDEMNYSSELVGVPLSESEANEVLRRSQVAYAIGEVGLKFQEDPAYGGTYLDNEGGGTGVFLFAENAEGRRAEIAQLLPAGIDFEVRAVRWSQMELLALQEAVERDRGSLMEQVGLVSTAISTSGNSVVVGLEYPSDAVKATLNLEYGEGLTYRVDEPSIADACVSDTDCRPVKGGLEINPRLGAMGTDVRCTSGFVVLNSNGYYNILTAGHCIEYWGGYNQTWYHHDNSYGQGRYDTFTVGAIRDGDVGLTTIFDHEIPIPNNQIYVGGGNVRNITGTRGLWDMPQGTPVQRYGTNSGWDSGVIYLRYVERPSCLPGNQCMTVRKQNEVDFDSRKGDSGGPVFMVAPSGGNNRLALGTHVHSGPDTDPNAHGWYTPEDVGREVYESLIGVGYVICSGIFSPCG